MGKQITSVIYLEKANIWLPDYYYFFNFYFSGDFVGTYLDNLRTTSL